MKTIYFTGLALAALLLTGGAASGHSDHRGGGKGGGNASHAVAARSGRSHSFIAVRTARTHSFANHGNTFAAVRGGSRPRGWAPNTFASSGRTGRTRPNLAFAGSAYNSGFRSNGRGSYGKNAYGYDSGRRYGRKNGHGGNGWYGGNDWDYPYVGVYPYAYPNYWYDYSGPSGYDNGNSVSTQVQKDLSQQGYYQGPVDGIVGPGTQAAIAAYQRANNLPVTGAIDGELLHSLGID